MSIAVSSIVSDSGPEDPTTESPATLPSDHPDQNAELPKLRVEYLDPNLLLDNKLNLRTDIGDLDDLLASIPEVGILCPLVVVEVGDGDFQIVIGHRRKYAAIQLQWALVPCIIAPDKDAAGLIVTQLAENGDRVALTPSEQAEGYHQLTLLDWTPEKIAKVRNLPAETVKKTLQLRALPDAAREAADAGTLTLDDAAAMAEFANEPTVMNRILTSGKSGWGFRHAVANERSKRDFTTAKERTKAELVLAGVKVTSKPKGWGYDSPATEASRLLDGAGQPVDPQQVRTRPGFAAFIERRGDQAHTVIYCTDPAEWGYTKRGFGVSAADQAAQDEADREREILEEGLTIAAGVRADFYRTTYAPARATKPLFVEALRQAVTGDGPMPFEDIDGLYAALGGADADLVVGAREDRLRRCLVARWICGHERNLGHAAAGQQWALDRSAALFWLDRLVADGYALSDAETTLRRALEPGDPEQTSVDAA